MKRILVMFIALALAGEASAQIPDVRIAQVFAGGGQFTGGFYKKDYVVLFNNSGDPVALGGYALVCGVSTGNWGSQSGYKYTLPVGTTIAPCSYLLIACGASGSSGTDLPVTPDLVTGQMSMAPAAFKLGLFTTLTGNDNVPCGSEAPGTLVDKVSWGATANCAEGSPAPAQTVSSGIDRLNGGTTDTNDNSADFVLVPNPVPMNSATPAWPCEPTGVDSRTWGAMKSLFR